MKAVDIKSVTIQGEDGSSLRMLADNRGEPFRQGVSIWIERPGESSGPGLFLEVRDVNDAIAGLQKLLRHL